MSQKKRKKRLCPREGHLIGIDESNNGFNSFSRNKIHLSNPNLIIAGYLLNQEEHASYHHNEEIEKKGVFNNNNQNLDSKIQRACDFLENNPNFYYVKLSKKEAEKVPMFILRAKAAAGISLKFISDYHLDPKNIVIILDDINQFERSKYEIDKTKLPKIMSPMERGSFSHCVHETMQQYFQKANVITTHYSRRYADEEVSAVKKADRASFFLSTLAHFDSESFSRYDSRKINLDKLDSMTNFRADFEDKLVQYKTF